MCAETDSPRSSDAPDEAGGLAERMRGVAHDINNMLAAITGYASLLELRVKEDVVALRAIERIIQSAERAAMLTDRMLHPERQPDQDAS